MVVPDVKSVLYKKSTKPPPRRLALKNYNMNINLCGAFMARLLLECYKDALTQSPEMEIICFFS